MGFLSGWNYRKSHVINAQAGAGDHYQVKIIIHYGPGTDLNGDIYCTVGGVAHCRTDFGDIRFTDNDGSTLLDCWMESKTNSDNAVFWVEVIDSLTTNPVTIYVYYGKADATYPYLATDLAQGEATFPFFDNFSISPNGWTLYLNVTISGGYLNILPNAYLGWSSGKKTRPAGLDDYRFRFRANIDNLNNWGYFACPRGERPNGQADPTVPFFAIGDTSYSPISAVRFVTKGSINLPYLLPARDANWHILQVLKMGSSYKDYWSDYTGTVTVTNGAKNVTGSGTAFRSTMVGKYFVSTDGVEYLIDTYTDPTHIILHSNYGGPTLSGQTYGLITSGTDATAETGTQVWFGNWGWTASTTTIDWVFLAKYVYPEPAHSTWGGEELPQMTQFLEEYKVIVLDGEVSFKVSKVIQEYLPIFSTIIQTAKTICKISPEELSLTGQIIKTICRTSREELSLVEEILNAYFIPTIHTFARILLGNKKAYFLMKRLGAKIKRRGQEQENS